MKMLDFPESFGWLAAIVGGIALLNLIARNPKLNPRYRFIARKLEGDLYQDLVTGQFIVFA